MSRRLEQRLRRLELKLAPKPPDLGWLVPWFNDTETVAEAEARFIRQHGRLPDGGYMLCPAPELTEAEWIARYCPE